MSNNNKPILFIHIPKCCGFTIREVLKIKVFRNITQAEEVIRFPERAGATRVSFGHLDTSLYNFSRFFIFSFVRNPYTRVQSLFKYLRVVYPFLATEDFETFCSRVKERAHLWKGTYNGWLSLFKPQVAWLSHVKLDFLGHFETFETDLRAVSEQLDIPITTIPIINQSEVADCEYTSASRGFIADFYREDFEIFGYEM